MDELWLAFCSLLVFMMVFGLAFIYGGLVRYKNAYSALFNVIFLMIQIKHILHPYPTFLPVHLGVDFYRSF